MNFIKKNLNIIIPSAIAVIALLMLIPTVMLRGQINKDLSKSIGLGKSIDSAIRSAVPQKQFEVEKQYQDAHADDANDIKILTAQSSRRSLLSYKIFPDPNETSIQIFNEFSDAYKKVFAGFIDQLSALDAPSDIEIRKEIGGDTTSARSGRSSHGRTSARNDARDDKDSEIIELICKRRCEEITVYANPKVFGGNAFWDTWEYLGSAQAVRDCWYSQLACWIHQDVVDTITSLNGGSSTVVESPVKRLLGVRFDSGDAVFTRGSTTVVQDDIGLPIYVSELQLGLCDDWTGRLENEQIDIVHFSVAVVVRSKDVLRFMQELCSEKTHTFYGYKGTEDEQEFKHNQITVLKSDIEPVDVQSALHDRYRYGSDAVVSLNLICQYIFNRAGYDGIKPESVKTELGQNVVDAPASSRRRGR
ncbi:MAG: hypothetical protein K8R02_08905 [Anaerohalosphaeraceae bacterium]|nr:hypothetical protein [Anaerohalosphaeraceae bacterium]